MRGCAVTTGTAQGHRLPARRPGLRRARSPLLVAAVLLLFSGGPAAEEAATTTAAGAGRRSPADESLMPPIFEIDEATRAILEKINAAGPYEVPDLDRRKDELYAGTPDALAPFGAVDPFKRHFLEQMVYTGPGRAMPEPEHVESVKLGFIGPIMPTVSVATGGASHEEELGIQMLRGSRLAVEEANARGGHAPRDIPFELVVKNDNGLWGASGNEIVDMAYKDRVWAILGTIDGANSHIAIRVALKAEVFMINTGDTDPTFIETNIPWVARVIGDDRRQGYLMVDYLYRKLGLERVGIIRASNRYGRFGVREIKDGSRRLGRPIVQEMAYQVGSDDFSLHLERLRRAGAQAIVHWGNAREAALILNQMRREGMEQPFFASDRAVSAEFVDLAGGNAEGVMAGFPWDPTRKDPALEAFRKRFRARFGVPPDTYAAHAYDGMNMLIWAVNAAGLNRARIRDVIAYRPEPWPGVTGDIPLSATLDDVGEVTLAEHRDGRWRYRTREDLGMARGEPAQAARSRRGAAEALPAGEEPGRGGPEEIRIAWFAPHGDDPIPANDPWHAAKLAIEDTRRTGGPVFRLLPVWSEDPWGTGIGELARTIYEEEAVAVISGADGAAAHLAEQVAAKARLPLINAVSTDESVNMASVPWTFSFLPGDTVQAGALAGEILRRPDAGETVVVSALNHDTRRMSRELISALARRGTAPGRHLEFDGGEEAAAAMAEEVAVLEPPVVVILAGPGETAVFLRTLRGRLEEVAAYGGAVMGGRAFREASCPSSWGTLFPRLCDPAALSPEFAAAFRERTGAAPDCAAAQTWDATRMLVRAVRRAGPARGRVRQALASLTPAPGAEAGSAPYEDRSGMRQDPWRGEAGIVLFDTLGRNLRPVRLAAFGGTPSAGPAAR